MPEAKQAMLHDRWLNALRSGNYRQTRNMLYQWDNEGYCCLGVADKVCFNATFDDYGRDDKGAIQLLPTDRSRRLGLDAPVLEQDKSKLEELLAEMEIRDFVYVRVGSSRENVLVGMNDAGYTFKEIANVIEKMNWHRG